MTDAEILAEELQKALINFRARIGQVTPPGAVTNPPPPFGNAPSVPVVTPTYTPPYTPPSAGFRELGEITGHTEVNMLVTPFTLGFKTTKGMTLAMNKGPFISAGLPYKMGAPKSITLNGLAVGFNDQITLAPDTRYSLAVNDTGFPVNVQIRG